MSKPTTTNPQISTQKDKNVAQGFIIFIVAVAAIGAITNNSTPAADPVVYGKESSLQDLSDNTLNNRMRFIKTNEGVEINDERNKPKEEEKKEEAPKEEPKKEEPKPEEKKQEAPKEEAKPEPAPKQEEEKKEEPKREPVPVSNTDFIQRANSLGVSTEVAQAMATAASEKGFKPGYLLAIGLSENATNPTAVGDQGCSFGVYQMNLCVHKTTTLHSSILDCAKDFLCSSRWTAHRVVTNYGGKADSNGDVDNWIAVLSNHNGYLYPAWYAAKIEKNGIKAGLSY